MKANADSSMRKRIVRLRRAMEFAFSSEGNLPPRALQPPKAEMVDFYDEKSALGESFVYRRLAYDLAGAVDKAQRVAIFGEFKQHLEENGGRGEFLKFKWCMPSFLSATLHTDERADLEAWLSLRRSKRNRRYVGALPHCTDEFGVGTDFLEAAFSIPETAAIARDTRVFTMGSCFARNIAVFLKANGYNAESFVQTEDLNSPQSNAQMLSVATARPSERDAYLTHWLREIHASIPDNVLARRVRKAAERLDCLIAELQAASVIIVTIGNVLDFFIEDSGESFDIPGLVGVAPKFLLVSDTVELTQRTAVGNRLKSLGAIFRMGSLSEARGAIASLYAAIRRINPSALCIFTLSPVPIDNAVGLQGQLSYGALEVDCVSKSTLRVAIHELMSEWAGQDPSIRYFPSYEIVRWIGPLLPEPAFGAEDAVSRHVSSAILNGVYSYFLKKFGATQINAQADLVRPDAR